MRVGITGHQRLADPGGWTWVESEMERILSGMPRPLVGLTSLAIGADQRFADLILRQGGTFRAIIPFAEYETKFADGEDRDGYDRLFALADRVDVLRTSSGREAYLQAGKLVVNMSELLIAVWDGRPAAGLGGTGDVVEFARKCGIPMIQLDPVSQTIVRYN